MVLVKPSESSTIGVAFASLLAGAWCGQEEGTAVVQVIPWITGIGLEVNVFHAEVSAPRDCIDIGSLCRSWHVNLDMASLTIEADCKSYGCYYQGA